MHTFISERIEADGQRWAGPEIEAVSWEQAQSIAQALGVILVGELS